MTRLFESLLALSVFATPASAAGAQESARSAAHEEFGRLFFDPSQRAAARAAHRPSTSRMPAEVPPGAEADEPSTRFNLNGVAIDGSGRMTLWVNGARYEPVGMMTIVALDTPGRVRVTLAERTTPIELRVGQQLELASRRVVEGFEATQAVAIADTAPIAATNPTPQAARSKRLSPRPPALHLHVHTAKPGPRRKAARREDD